VFGCKPAPSIKIATNTPLYQHMSDDMDIDAGVILAGTPVVEVGRHIFEFMLEVASGRKTKSELVVRRRGGVSAVGDRADCVSHSALRARGDHGRFQS